MRNVTEKIFQNSVFFIAAGVMAVIVMSHQTNHAAAPATADAKIGPIWVPLTVDTGVNITVGEFAIASKSTNSLVTVTYGGILGTVTSISADAVGTGVVLGDAAVTAGSFTIGGEPNRPVKLSFSIVDSSGNDGVSFAILGLDLEGTASLVNSSSTAHGALRPGSNTGTRANNINAFAVASGATTDAWLDLPADETTIVSFGGVFTITAASHAAFPKEFLTVATITLNVAYDD